jgi:hypothetical protein
MATEQNQMDASREHDQYLVDRRLTILETRFDTILPTLATKADLAELKAELKGDIAGLSRWMATLAVTMVLGFAGMFATMLTLLRH